MKYIYTILPVIYLAICTTSSIVSFYGRSFIYQSVGSIGKNSTVISLRFYTSSSNGIILHATGGSQYLHVALKSQQLLVKINLGYGEEVLSLSEANPVNNLIWHQLKIIRSARIIRLNFNGKDEDIVHLAGPRNSGVTFNPDFGIFLGGIGAEIAELDGIGPMFFKGCILEAKWNGQDLLSPLESDGANRIVSNVFPGCSQIFSSAHNSPITFSSPSSYISLDRWLLLGEANFECVLKTTETDGIIMYNADIASGRFVVLNMVDGVIEASVDKGNGVLGLRTTSPINDGVWHSVKFTFNPSYFDIRVDGNKTRTYFEQKTSISPSVSVRPSVSDLDPSLYIGGIPQHFHQRGSSQRLLSLHIIDGKATLGGAFPGCIKHIKVNHRKKGFQEFASTHMVSTGCSLRPFAVPIPSGLDFWEASDKVSDLFAMFSQERTTSTTSHEVETTTQLTTTTVTPKFQWPQVTISTNILEGVEAGSASLTRQCISWTISHMGHNISDCDILLLIGKKLRHGRIVKSVSCDDNVLSVEQFTLNDVAAGSLLYCHDGSDTLSDRALFTAVWDLSHMTQEQRNVIVKNTLVNETEFLSTGVALNQGKEYTIDIAITPVDDPPKLIIPLDYVFRPIKNVPTHFSNFVLNATDPDSTRNEIVYSVLAETENDEFWIENDDIPGRSISEFTQADLDARRITFTFRSDRDNARLILRLFNNPADDARYPVQDRKSFVLRIAGQLLNISATVKKVNLLEKKFVVISDDSITVSLNSEPRAVALFGHVMKTPTLGILELKDGQRWSQTTNFTMEHLTHGLIRYRNLERTKLGVDYDTDGFDFYLTAVGVRSPTYHMPILIKRVNIILSLSPIILDKGIQEVLLSTDYMNVSANDIVLHNDHIQIGLEMETKHVQVFYNDKNLILGAKDTFTYRELKQGRISLRVKTRYTTHGFQELIQLFSVVDDVYTSTIRMMNVTYVPHLDRIVLVKNDLKIDEGREKIIGIQHLKASLPSNLVNSRIKTFQYHVLQFPKHGILKNKNLAESGSSNNISAFYSSDLERNAVVYVNDDSESTSDSFTFRVSPVLEGQASQVTAKLSNVSLEEIFWIDIVPVNDQRPFPVVNKVFEVCRNCERLMTLDDIRYKDDDSDSNNLDLWITIRGRITNGEILNATNRAHEKITRFTQRQIQDGEVLFQHQGLDNGRFVFYVRDGRHYVPGLITISASDPYLRNAHWSVVTVIKGKDAVVSSSDLAYITNVKGSPKDIIYRVLSGPNNGMLYLNHTTINTAEGSVTMFTQEDVNSKLLKYKHGGAPVWNDIINLSISAGTLSAYGNISIQIQLASHTKPPSVQKNRTIIVSQGRKVEIRKQNLRAVHPDAKAGDIKLNVVQHPRFGELLFLSDVDTNEFNTKKVTDFTQADINQGKVWYSQNDSFVYTDSDFIDGVLLDRFVFNVTNGLMTLPDQSFGFDIIPRRIPLRVGNFSVREGKSKAIIRDCLWIEGHHFEADNIEIQIVTQPLHGIFESLERDGVALTAFNYRLVVEEFVYYAHDDSDSLHDRFRLQAFTLDKRQSSEIRLGDIDVIPENDERPVIVNNTGLHVWSDSITVLLPSALAAFDADTLPSLLEFQVLPASNGFIAVASDPTHPIFKFTQEDINNGNVTFVHKGAATGGFAFQCSDGFEPTKKLIFVVTASPLIITVMKPQIIQAFPGELTMVSNETISTQTNDLLHPNRTIIFTVTSFPSMGHLVKMPSSNAETASTFTQQDINDGLIFYSQNVNFEKWTATDSFVLTAASPPGKLVEDVKVSVNITYYAILGRSPIQLNIGQTVTEGEKAPINTTVLDAANLFKKLPFHVNKKNYNLIYSVMKLPSHGNLTFSAQVVVEPNSTFSQSDLETNKIWYQHDDSDTMKDSISLLIYLVDTRYKSSAGTYWVVPGTSYQENFNITILPLNDNPPVLLTKGKVMHVVDGFEKFVSIKYLNSRDADNSPREIEYSIIRQPLKGIVAFLDDPDTPIIKFNQEDIATRKVLFVPSKLNLTNDEIVRDFFYFGITDGIQRSSYNAFQIKIHAVYLKFHPGIMNLLQGESSMILSADLLNISTNGNISLLSFQVIQPTRMGVIMVREEKSASFTYQDIIDEQVLFTLTSNDITSDEMQVKVFYDKGNSDLSMSVGFNVAMKAFVRTPDTVDMSGAGLNRIDLETLDASLLYKRTGSMPLYSIVEKPDFSEFMKVIPHIDLARSKRNVDDRYSTVLVEAHNFTHEDVSLGYVFFSLKNESFEQGRIKIRLSVEDQSVPPAIFNLPYHVTDKEAEDFTAFLASFLPIEKTTLAQALASPTSSYDSSETDIDDGTVSGVSTSRASNVELSKDHDAETTISQLDKPGIEVEKAAFPLWLPILLVAISVLIIVIIVTVLICRRKTSLSNQDDKTAHRDDNKQENVVTKQGTTQRASSNGVDNEQIDARSHKPLSSPACPGVTVTLLNNSGMQDAAEPLLPPLLSGIDDSPSYLASTYGPYSVRDSQQSTVYCPSTAYYFDDLGSVELVDYNESDIFSHGGDYRTAARLYHAKSDKFIDPDVLALYSSDESIPSMLDEKYAISSNNANGLTGSVPSGLHKSSTQIIAGPAGISTSRSTASLSKMSPGAELSLPPNSPLETNQYWI